MFTLGFEKIAVSAKFVAKRMRDEEDALRVENLLLRKHDEMGRIATHSIKGPTPWKSRAADLLDKKLRNVGILHRALRRYNYDRMSDGAKKVYLQLWKRTK